MSTASAGLAQLAADHPSIAELVAAAQHHPVRLPGGTVSWRSWGTGTPLVLLHGGHGCWLHWVRNIEALATAHRVLVPDMPGFGESDDLPLEPHDPTRLDALVEACAASLQVLLPDGTPFDLAGFSFGGMVAGLLAARLPQVHRLALLGPGGHGGARRQPVPMQDWRLPDPGARRAALRQNLYNLMLHADTGDAMALDIHAHACEHTRLRSRAFSRQPLLVEALRPQRRPVLLLWGEHDVTAEPQAAAETLAQQRSERTRHIEAGAGHWVQYERAAQVDAQLLAWCKS